MERSLDFARDDKEWGLEDVVGDVVGGGRDMGEMMGGIKGGMKIKESFI